MTLVAAGLFAFESLSHAVMLMAALLCMSFFFSGTETALFSLQKVHRQRLAAGTALERLVMRLRSNKVALIGTLMLGNETANVALAATGAIVAQKLVPEFQFLNVLIVTPLLVVLSEITPKVLAFRFNTRWARITVLPLAALYYALAPLRWLVTLIVGTLAAIFGVRPDLDERGVHEAEIRSLVEQGAAQGDLEDRDREVIEAVLDFGELSVGRLMTPLPDVKAVPLDISWDDLVQAVRESEHSRLPVYRDHPDEIEGVLLVHHLLPHRRRPPRTLRGLRSLLLPALFVPQSKGARDMMEEFLEQQQHMAFVVDEHGTLVGLVTLDDLLEELVAEDDELTESGTLSAAGIRFAVPARVDIADFGEDTGITLPEGDYHTVGGFVFHQLGRLPQAGDVVEHEGYRFSVASVEHRRIVDVIVEPIRDRPPPLAADAGVQ